MSFDEAIETILDIYFNQGGNVKSCHQLVKHQINSYNDFIENKWTVTVGGWYESFELAVRNANVRKMDNWLAIASEKFKHYKLAFYEDIPDNLLSEYCAVFTELLYDMPANSEIGDLRITPEQISARQKSARKQNQSSYRYLIFNEHNRLIAKTNVWVNKNNPQIVHQYMTGVLKDYRGQGLAKWLKAAMFKKLLLDFPDLEKIETETHPNNHGSRELSKQMGFEKTGYSKEFLIPKESILAFLGK